MNPLQPKSSCIQCFSYALVHYTQPYFYQCLECNAQIDSCHIDNIIVEFSKIPKDKPYIIKKNDFLICPSCLISGGISFNKNLFPTVSCILCDQSFTMDTIHAMKTMAFKTKLIETAYDYIFLGEE